MMEAYLALCVVGFLAILLAVYGDICAGYAADEQREDPPVILSIDLDRLEHRPGAVWMVQKFADGCELWTCLRRHG